MLRPIDRLFLPTSIHRHYCFSVGAKQATTALSVEEVEENVPCETKRSCNALLMGFVSKKFEIKSPWYIFNNPNQAEDRRDSHFRKTLGLRPQRQQASPDTVPAVMKSTRILCLNSLSVARSSSMRFTCKFCEIHCLSLSVAR